MSRTDRILVDIYSCPSKVYILVHRARSIPGTLLPTKTWVNLCFTRSTIVPGLLLSGVNSSFSLILLKIVTLQFDAFFHCLNRTDPWYDTLDPKSSPEV